MSPKQLVATRMVLASIALALVGGVVFIACGDGMAPTAPSSVSATNPASESGSSTVVPTASAAAAGQACAAPKIVWCHVPDGQQPREICIDRLGVADHERHPKDYPVKTFYADGDGDGYGSGTLEIGCAVPSGYVEQSGDCNDANASVNPGAAEVCDDGVDDDCDGLVDAADPDCPLCLVPAIRTMTPNSGSAEGGTRVEIAGENFTDQSTTIVTVGGIVPVQVDVTATRIAFTTPAHPAGQVDVIVATPCGTASMPFRYVGCLEACGTFELAPSPFFSNVQECVDALQAAAQTQCCSGVLNPQGGFVFGTSPEVCRGYCGTISGSCVPF